MSVEADLYRQGKSIYQIAPIIGLTPPGVWYRLKRQGVRMSNRRRAVNEAFLDTWTPESAYAVGLLCTDGTIAVCRRRGGRPEAISLTSEDRILVERFRALFGSEHKIGLQSPKTGPYKGRKYYRVNITSRRLAQTAVQLGIMPNKSLILAGVPVPDTVFGPFLAGVIDGDGTIDLISKGKIPLRIRIPSGSEKFRDFLHRKTAGLGVTGVKTKSQRDTGCMYSVEFASHNAVALANLVYLGHEFGLERKRAVAMPFVSSEPAKEILICR